MQSSNNILMVKPANFGFNSETAESNAFQHQVNEEPAIIVQEAIREFDAMVEQLSNKGINVLVIEDTPHPIKPDAIFPNNWGSFHADSSVILYPMLADNRRTEKRKEILDIIRIKFEINEIIDLSVFEEKTVFLEGTGSIIFDHTFKIAYACLSPRTDKHLLIETCKMIGYEPIYFIALDNSGKEIYHTNVMMNIGNGYAVVCLESIKDESEKNKVIRSLTKTDKQIIEITYKQMESFCGNMIELELIDQKNILTMSQSAFDQLTVVQKNILSSYCELFPIKVNTIERIGGGSVRCMISELFLPKLL